MEALLAPCFGITRQRCGRSWPARARGDGNNLRRECPDQGPCRGAGHGPARPVRRQRIEIDALDGAPRGLHRRLGRDARGRDFRHGDAENPTICLEATGAAAHPPHRAGSAARWFWPGPMGIDAGFPPPGAAWTRQKVVWPNAGAQRASGYESQLPTCPATHQTFARGPAGERTGSAIRRQGCEEQMKQALAVAEHGRAGGFAL